MTKIIKDNDNKSTIRGGYRKGAGRKKTGITRVNSNLKILEEVKNRIDELSIMLEIPQNLIVDCAIVNINIESLDFFVKDKVSKGYVFNHRNPKVSDATRIPTNPRVLPEVKDFLVSYSERLDVPQSFILEFAISNIDVKGLKLFLKELINKGVKIPKPYHKL